MNLYSEIIFCPTFNYLPDTFNYCESGLFFSIKKITFTKSKAEIIPAIEEIEEISEGPP